MKRFIKNIILFLLPIIILMLGILPFYSIALYCGEFIKIDDNIEKQRENNYSLIGMGYNEQTEYYKLVNANYYQADIIALGTSRVMQFKGEFFKTSFYNCGGAVDGNYNQYINFLKNLHYKPSCILLGIDAWVFNDAWNRSCKEYKEYIEIRETNRSKGTMLKNIIGDWSEKKWRLDNLDDYPENIGFNGKIKDEGFMYDGSYYYGSYYRYPEEQEDYLFENTLSRIQNGVRRFEWGDHIDQDTVTQLENLLLYCSQNHIEVIGIVTPFAPTIYETMQKSGNYGYLEEIEPECRVLFDKYGFELYNYMDGLSLSVTDDCFIDGFHGSEIVYGYMLIDMKRNGSKARNYMNINDINYLLKNAYNGKVFYEPDNRLVR